MLLTMMLAGLCLATPAKQYPGPRPTTCVQVPGWTAKQSLDGDLLQCINEMRENPPAFYRKYVGPYIRENQSRFTRRYTESLRKTMLASAPLPLFSTQEALRQCASLQARYIASEGGRLTHSQGNVGFAERMKQAGLHCLAENLYAAHDPGALQVVIDLLIDQNIPSLGHRKNLLNAAYGFIGIVHKTISAGGGKTIVVMDFGCKH
jgi:uncharacterized protein YkwD